MMDAFKQKANDEIKRMRDEYSFDKEWLRIKNATESLWSNPLVVAGAGAAGYLARPETVATVEGLSPLIEIDTIPFPSIPFPGVPAGSINIHIHLDEHNKPDGGGIEIEFFH